MRHLTVDSTPSDLPSGIVVLWFAVLGANLDVAVLAEVNHQDEQNPEFLQSFLYKTEPKKLSYHRSDIKPGEADADPFLPGHELRLSVVRLGDGEDGEREDDEQRDPRHDGVEREFGPLEILVKLSRLSNSDE